MLYLTRLREAKFLLPYHLEKLPRVGERSEPVRPPDKVAKERATDCQRQILLIGDDPSLQFSRRKILESAGYSVRSAKSNLVVEELLLRGIELILLCHSIAEERMAEIVRAFTRLAPQIPVLLISSSNYRRMDEGTPASVPTHPAAFLDAVAATLAHQG